MQILLVDDDAFIIEHVKRSLPEYNIIGVTDPRQTIEVLNKETINLILMDVMMPIIDGFSLCKMIKKQPKFEEIPIFFLTSLSSPEELIEGFKAGAVDYIHKPIMMEELKARISAHVKLIELKNKVINQREMDAIKSLVVTIKHVFNNHLTVIQGFSELIEVKNDNDRQIKEKILESVDNLDRMIRKLENITTINKANYLKNTEMLNI